jgi:23S rRNA pseudouridine1911/1915/1917 synthase
MSVFLPDEEDDEDESAPRGRPAETFYQVRERFGEFALLDCLPKTGRTHQIRVHLAHIGHSIVGDPLYRSKRAVGHPLPKGAPRLGRQALHARRLVLRHPATGERLVLEAPPPPDLAALIDHLRGLAAGE